MTAANTPKNETSREASAEDLAAVRENWKHMPNESRIVLWSLHGLRVLDCMNASYTVTPLRTP